MATPPWPPGSATGVGSLSGEDIRAAVRTVFDELPDFPHLPELPARGPGSDMVGRTAAALEGLHVDLQPAGWRLVARPGVDERRGRDLLERDLDALQEQAQGYRGPLKAQLAGPLTLAAAVELTRGDRALADPGAVRDLVGSLAEAAAAHVREVRERVPGARVVLQLDEPGLRAVLAGSLPTVSGFGRLPAVPAADAAANLARVVAAAGVPVVVHVCGNDPMSAVVAAAGVRAVGVDVSAAVASPRDEALGELVEAGVALHLGLVPALGPGVPPSVRDVLAPARALWQRLGLPAERHATPSVVTPVCGLAGASLGWSLTAMRLARQAARAMAEATA